VTLLLGTHSSASVERKFVIAVTVLIRPYTKGIVLWAPGNKYLPFCLEISPGKHHRSRHQTGFQSVATTPKSSPQKKTHPSGNTTRHAPSYKYISSRRTEELLFHVITTSHPRSVIRPLETKVPSNQSINSDEPSFLVSTNHSPRSRINISLQ